MSTRRRVPIHDATFAARMGCRRNLQHEPAAIPPSPRIAYNFPLRAHTQRQQNLHRNGSRALLTLSPSASQLPKGAHPAKYGPRRRQKSVRYIALIAGKSGLYGASNIVQPFQHKQDIRERQIRHPLF